MENSKSDQKIFSENICLLRKVHLLLQKEMAKIMGVSVYCLRKAEQGVFANSLGVDAIINLSQHFHLPPDKLFTPREEWSNGLLLNAEQDI